MSLHSFAESIGQSLFVALKYPIVDREGNEQFWIDANLLGHEAGGLWLKSPQVDAFFEHLLWQLEMEEGGPAAVGSSELGFFIPFSQIRFVQIVLPRSGDSQGR